MTTPASALTSVTVGLLLLATGCAGHQASSAQSTVSAPSSPAATEYNPPGDIPDDQVFVDYAVPDSAVHIKVPEGWARSSKAGTTTFTDNFNSIAILVVPRAAAPTVSSAKGKDIPALGKSVANFQLESVTAVQRQHGSAVLVTYLLDSAPDQVTGKVVRDEAQRFEFWKNGSEAILTLTGPQHADNVDPWQLVSDSVTWR